MTILQLTIIQSVLLLGVFIELLIGFIPKNEKQKQKMFYRYLINQTNQGIWRDELSIKVVKQIREGIRLEYDRIADMVKGIEEEIEKVKAGDAKDKEVQLGELNDSLTMFKRDLDMMEEQMIGKITKDINGEQEKERHGGLDNEIKSIEEKIKGGEEFKNVLQMTMKKI